MTRWHKKGGFESVVFVPYTPEGILAKRMRMKVSEVMSGKTGGLRIVERVGVSILAMMKRTDPFRETTCGRPDCITCKNDKCGNCEKDCVGYEMWCIT